MAECLELKKQNPRVLKASSGSAFNNGIYSLMVPACKDCIKSKLKAVSVPSNIRLQFAVI